MCGRYPFSLSYLMQGGLTQQPPAPHHHNDSSAFTPRNPEASCYGSDDPIFAKPETLLAVPLRGLIQVFCPFLTNCVRSLRSNHTGVAELFSPSKRDSSVDPESELEVSVRSPLARANTRGHLLTDRSVICRHHLL